VLQESQSYLIFGESVKRIQAAALKHSRKSAAGKSEATTSGAGDKGRMVHIRLEPELHRKLRLVVAAEDTTLQEWIARTVEEAVDKAWPEIARGAGR
jgi:predicted HicB family RNase H-like nuclease